MILYAINLKSDVITSSQLLWKIKTELFKKGISYLGKGNFFISELGSRARNVHAFIRAIFDPARLRPFIVVYIWQIFLFSFLRFVLFFSLCQFSFDSDHLLLKKINEFFVFLHFLFFFRIEGSIFFFFFFLLLDFQFSKFLGQYSIIVLGLKLIPIEHIDCLIDGILILFYLLFQFVLDVGGTFDFLFLKLNHQIAIFVGSFIEKHDIMSVDGFIKNDVLDLAFRPTAVVPQLINKQKWKFEFEFIVFYKLEVVHERNWIFYLWFYEFAKNFYRRSVLYLNETLFVKNICVLVIGNHMHWTYCHEQVTELIVYD